jgi:hypothetical protein
VPALSLYVDDSGTRHPDHKAAGGFEGFDWFGLGGFLVNEEDEDPIRSRYDAFRAEWAGRVAIEVPLHSHKIRQGIGAFGWLRSEPREASRFLGGLAALIEDIPIRCTACVIDRPGHRARYSATYGPEQRWSLCRTAFSVLLERASKVAAKEGRRLRVYVEESDKKTDANMRRYYDELRANGQPFNAATMARYEPLDAEAFRATLYDLKFKRKTSALMQLADLSLYPVCRAGYDARGRDYQMLARKKLIDCFLAPEETERVGIKYSCFENVERRI